MLLKPLDVDQLKVFISTFSSDILRILDVAPGPRSLSRVKELGAHSSVYIKVSFTDGLAGNCLIGFSEFSACAVAARMRERLLKEKASFSNVGPEVSELLLTFANYIIQAAVEKFREYAINCSVSPSEVTDGRDCQTGEHEYILVLFPLGDMGEIELFLDLKMAVNQENAGRRIMIVDDTNSMRGMLRRILEEAGYMVVGEATNGREAINRVAALSPDLVTMDLEMPEVNGIQALEAIKQRHPQIKVIVMTSVLDREIVMECIRKGAINYILKPYEPAKVIEVLAKALS